MSLMVRISGFLQNLWGNLAAPTWRERLVYLFFFFTTFHAAFLKPHVTLVPGERSKLFAGLLGMIAMLVAFIFIRGAWRKLRSVEGAVSLVLLLLALASGLTSDYSRVALARGFVVMASGLGGFWCARILLDTPSRRFAFAWYEAFLLAGMLAVALSTFALGGNVWDHLDFNQHPLVARMVLMSFAALVMIFRKRSWLRISGVLLLGLSFTVFSLSSLRSAMFMPLVIGGALLVVGIIRIRKAWAFALPIMLIIGAIFYYTSLMESKLPGDYYRLESYAFSWEVAKERPLLGIGLMAPRDAYLDDYEMYFDNMTRETFINTVKYLISSENVFLTFMVGLGIPFAVIYGSSVLTLYILLVRRRRHANRGMTLPFPALLFPITAGLLHFLVSDGLMQPQVSWFFHILLGMIPVRDEMCCPETGDSAAAPV